MRLFWDILPEADWSAAIEAAGGAALQQSWAYGQALAGFGARVRRAVLREGGRDLAVVQVLERRGLRVILRGPVWLAPGDRRRALRHLARHPGATIATPEQGLGGLGLVPLITPRHQAIWDLSPNPEVLRAGLDAKWRGHLAAAERAGLRFGVNRRGALAALQAAEADQRRQRGYRALPPALVDAMAATPDVVTVWDWRSGGRVCAAMAFLRHGSRASYHLAWGDAAARKTAVHQAMLWQAALALRAQGVSALDLGDVNTETAMGLARFKLGTGAGLHRLGATLLVLP